MNAFPKCLPCGSQFEPDSDFLIECGARKEQTPNFRRDLVILEGRATSLGEPGSFWQRKILELVSAVIVLSFLAVGGQSQVSSSPAQTGTAGSPDSRSTQSRGLQRAATPAAVSSRDIECQRRHADWDRNRSAWSFFWGFAFYLLANLFLTFVRFKNTTVRVIVSIVIAALLGPSLLAVQMQDALKVCPNPPGFLGSLSAAIFVWTLAGGISTWLVICFLRYFVVSHQFRKRQTA